MALSGPGSVPTMPSVGNTVDAMLAKAAGMKAIVTEDAAEVGEGGQALDGIELDDKAVRAQQVVEQVSNLVKENPEVAASMIKKWMSRS
jgi:flagellar biosynthesis/type III secretory pathway M-ring protein FliF/YscJ